MTLPRKGTRKIAVGGLAYRWTVAPGDEAGIGVIIESAEAPAMRLVFRVQHGIVISPQLVRKAIELGIERGWRSHERGPDFLVLLDIDSKTGDLLRACLCCDFCSISDRGWDVCPVCGWEDAARGSHPDEASGPNHRTLREGRANFARTGNCDGRIDPNWQGVAEVSKRYVRLPRRLVGEP